MRHRRLAAGRRTAIKRGGEAMGPLSGAKDAYGYNGRNEVVSARRTLGGESVAGFNEDFSYDPIGNRISSTDYDETGAARTSTYTANNLNQYTLRAVPGWASVRGLADADAAVAVNGNPAYALANGDLAYFFASADFDNSTGGGFASLEVSATVNTGTNDLVSVVTNCVFVPSANETYAYDADGNQTLVMTGTGAWQVEYNGENRPVRWTCGDKTILMTFDYRGRRRLYVEVTAGVTNKLHRFTYDDYVCIARNREVDAQHGIGSDAFVWDPTEPIATRPLMCDLSGDGTLFYCHDGNKNVSEIVLTDGIIAAHYEYSAFGKVVLMTSEREDRDLTYFNPYRFSSEYIDDELGLVYYNYRHYEPISGRWLQRDPIMEYDFSMNLYFGLCNNMLSFVDVAGLKTVTIVTDETCPCDSDTWKKCPDVVVIDDVSSIEDLANRLRDEVEKDPGDPVDVLNLSGHGLLSPSSGVQFKNSPSLDVTNPSNELKDIVDNLLGDNPTIKIYSCDAAGTEEQRHGLKEAANKLNANIEAKSGVVRAGSDRFSTVPDAIENVANWFMGQPAIKWYKFAPMKQSKVMEVYK